MQPDEPTRDVVADEPLLAALREAVGAAHVLVGEDLAARATHVWDPAPLNARALVRPGSSAETGAVLALCHAAGQSVVTHGGLTGLVGGDRTSATDVIVSLERMDEIETIDPLGRTVTVGAGCVLERVQTAAREAGLQLGLDLGARGSCTIGGNIATNAGGLSVLRHGMMREQVLGLEAVLADGRVLSSMNRMLKNNAGYDLKQLFIGSEGTLGIVTRAVLRLRAATTSVQTALVAFERFEQVTGLLARLDGALNGSLNAYEVLWNRFYRLNTDPAHHGAATAPLGASTRSTRSSSRAAATTIATERCSRRRSPARSRTGSSSTRCCPAPNASGRRSGTSASTSTSSSATSRRSSTT